MAKEFEYVPKAFSAEDAAFEGKFVIKKAKCADRWDRVAKAGIDVSKMGELDAKSITTVVAIARLVEANTDMFVSVEVTKKATGEKFTSIDDVMLESELDPVVFELGGLFISGRPLARA